MLRFKLSKITKVAVRPYFAKPKTISTPLLKKSIRTFSFGKNQFDIYYEMKKLLLRLKTFWWCLSPFAKGIVYTISFLTFMYLFGSILLKLILIVGIGAFILRYFPKQKYYIQKQFFRFINRRATSHFLKTLFENIKK
ncbi:hypothetical protein MHBO_004519 [Bonamia ostreae]|uniref:Uncharacterized protein n=1 Tax=Bonamia ostreae TaxID=126728 RepID=A0ABV2AUC7_9EUKA